MPTAHEFDPLPLPDYGPLCSREDKRIADRLDQLAKHSDALQGRERRRNLSAICLLALIVIPIWHPEFTAHVILTLPIVWIIYAIWAIRRHRRRYS